MSLDTSTLDACVTLHDDLVKRDEIGAANKVIGAIEAQIDGESEQAFLLLISAIQELVYVG